MIRRIAEQGSIDKNRLIGFPADMEEAIAEAAAEDRVSFAEWMRRAAQYELRRRAKAEKRAAEGGR